jgi:hypothetical protein
MRIWWIYLLHLVKILCRFAEAAGWTHSRARLSQKAGGVGSAGTRVTRRARAQRRNEPRTQGMGLPCGEAQMSVAGTAVGRGARTVRDSRLHSRCGEPARRDPLTPAAGHCAAAAAAVAAAGFRASW